MITIVIPSLAQYHKPRYPNVVYLVGVVVELVCDHQIRVISIFNYGKHAIPNIVW